MAPTSARPALRRSLPLLVLLLAGCLPGMPPRISVTQEESARLQQVRSIYVDELGDANQAELIRETIRARLFDTDRFRVVGTAGAADAILRGEAGVELVVVQGRGSERAFGRFRLVDRVTSDLLWSHVFEPGLSLDHRIPDRIANKLVEQLLVDAGP